MTTILNAILAVVNGIVQAILAHLPVYNGLPSGLSDGLDYVLGLAASVDGFVPAGTIISIFVLVMAIELTILVFHAVAWIAHWRQK